MDAWTLLQGCSDHDIDVEQVVTTKEWARKGGVDDTVARKVITSVTLSLPSISEKGPALNSAQQLSTEFEN